MSDIERDVTKILLMAIGVAALYDILSIGKGAPAVNILGTGFKGFGGILARLTGGTAPAGF